MKRLDIIISHELIREVNDTLHKNKVGGMTFFDIKGRGQIIWLLLYDNLILKAVAKEKNKKQRI